MIGKETLRPLTSPPPPLPAGSVHTREQAGLLSAMEPAMLAWAAARDAGEDDSDELPAAVLGLLAALAAHDGGSVG